ncbi:hypothetical protein [Bradyrhizobium shewense]|uniref:hypothetical protein n=1 Tax=Bradyrhizobium shewense TaxID=1761772 RepID=UPI001FD8E533|nr:hypothetical protein [Bradyrhizobium shewense]
MISKDLLGCATARTKATCNNRLNIRRVALEACVLRGLDASHGARIVQGILPGIYPGGESAEDRARSRYRGTRARARAH